MGHETGDSTTNVGWAKPSDATASEGVPTNVSRIVLDGGHGAKARLCPPYKSYSGNSGSRRALRFAVVAEAEVLERTKLQRMLEAARESCLITIWAVRRGPSLPARKTLSSSSTLSSRASKVQTSRFGSTSITPRASLSRLAFTDGCR